MRRAAWVVALALSACVSGGVPSDAGGVPGKDAGPPGVPFDAGLPPPFNCLDQVPEPRPGFSRVEDGGTPVDTRVVFAPLRPPPAISGGTLAVMSDGTVVAADPDRDRVWLLGVGETTARSVALALGEEPGRVVEGPAGRAFVALRAAAQVAEIDLATAKVKARHPACAAPRGMAWSPARGVLTVACATGALARLAFDAGGAPTGRTLQHPADDLRDLVALPDGGMLVSSFRRAEVFRVADDGTAVRVAEPEFTHVPKDVAWRMIADPAGALVLSQRTHTPPDGGTCGTSYGGLGFKPIVQSALSSVGDGEHEPLGHEVPPLAVDLAASPSGARFAVAGAGKNTVSFMRASVLNQDVPLAGEPTSVAFRGEDTVFVFSREPARLFRFAFGTTWSLAQTVELGGDSVRSTAHALFHRTTKLDIACASCHPEGGEDGHIWRLPEGPRRTNSLRGGLKTSAPFHWQGDRPTLKALLADVMFFRMGAELPHAPAIDAFLDWMDALPALPAPETLDVGAVARGKTLFEAPARGCLTCHSGPLGTNNANSDIGTGGAFQVPRLVDMAARAPYFHDGSIATLEARFATTGNLHGNTSTLTAAEISDLVTYLKSR